MSDEASKSPLCQIPFDPPGPAPVTTQAVTQRSQPGRWINQYQVLTTVGTGQHGTVYLCQEIVDGVPCQRALKQVKRHNPSSDRWKKLHRAQLPASAHVPLIDRVGTTEQKIRKEIAIMKKCRHANVVRLLEVIDDRLLERIYISMEYMGGGEVKWKNLNNEPILTLAQTRRIMRDAIIGLEYLHHQGIIHRDIKPANLLWTEDRSAIKIADFGVSHFSYAQRMAAASKTNEPTDADDTLDPLLLDDSDISKRAGTPSFLAPEIIFEHTATPPGSEDVPLPHPPITKAIDIWSLGVTMYCLLFARTPFRPEEGAGNNEFSMYNNICNQPWQVEPTMGLDRVSTSEDEPDSEAHDVLHLLDHILQKDANRRIVLQDIKRHHWITRDLPNADAWVQKTSPWPMLQATDKEVGSAMSALRFRWAWKGISSLFRIRPSRSKSTTPPLPPVQRHKSAIENPDRYNNNTLPRLHRPDSYSGASISRRNKGKQRAEIPSHDATRSKSIERWPTFKKRNSSNLGLEGSAQKPRRRSETMYPSPTSDSGPSSPTNTKSRFSAIFGWRPSKYDSTSPADDSPASSSRKKFPAQNFKLSGQQSASIDNLGRRSDDAFHLYNTPRGITSGILTSARRTSSWDETGGMAEAVSLNSGEMVELDDQAMIVGAGGVCEDPPYMSHHNYAAAESSSAVASGSAVPLTILHQQEHFAGGSQLPPMPDPSMQDAGSFSRTGSRLTTTSPLANVAYDRQQMAYDQISLDSSNFGSVIEQGQYGYGDDDDDDYYDEDDDALEITSKKARSSPPQQAS